MINNGKCPTCGNIVSTVRVEGVQLTGNIDIVPHTLSYVCPHCNTILSIQIDPLIIKREILKDLRRGF